MNRTYRSVIGILGFTMGVVVMEASALAVTVTRVCLLTGSQEVPAVASTGFGGGWFVIDTAANTVTYRIVFDGMATAETVAHIHGFADPGVSAGVLHSLPLGKVKTGVWNYSQAQEANILAGKCYVNIHSVANTAGELRGQIVTHVADLDAAQENAGVVSAGRGFGLFNIDTNANTLSYYISYSGLTSAETMAHIHGYSRHLANSGVVHGLPLGALKTGVWTYPEANEQQILDGMTYVNIHTANFGGGEIRGQISPIVVPCDGTQERPNPNASTTTGYALCSIDRAGDVFGYDLRRGNFATAETLNHIHGYAPPTGSAGVKVNLVSLGNPRKLGTWAYPTTEEGSILAGLAYFNMHTGAFGGGEIRGNIFFPSLTKQPAPPPCVADVDDGTATGTPDGGVGIEDLLYYLALFEAGTLGADVDDGTGNGIPDGGVGIEDLLYYLLRFEAGC